MYTSENEKPGSPTPSVYLRLPGTANENAGAHSRIAKGEGFSGSRRSPQADIVNTGAARPRDPCRDPPPQRHLVRTRAAAGRQRDRPRRLPDPPARLRRLPRPRGRVPGRPRRHGLRLLPRVPHPAKATHRAAEEARAAAPRAFVTDDTHNAYQLPGTDPNLPDNHPRNVPMRTRVASTAYDELAGSQLHALYNLNFDPFVQFGGSGIESQVYKYHKECILLSRLPGRGGACPSPPRSCPKRVPPKIRACTYMNIADVRT